MVVYFFLTCGKHYCRMHEYLGKPLIQVLVFTFLSVVVIAISRPKDANAVYTIAGIVYIAFILVNSFYIVFIPNVWTYFFYSMLFSLLYLLIISIIIPGYINIAKIMGSGESGMIFLVIMYHPVAALLVIFLKWIYLRVF